MKGITFLNAKYEAKNLFLTPLPSVDWGENIRVKEVDKWLVSVQNGFEKWLVSLCNKAKTIRFKVEKTSRNLHKKDSFDSMISLESNEMTELNKMSAWFSLFMWHSEITYLTEKRF